MLIGSATQHSANVVTEKPHMWELGWIIHITIYIDLLFYKTVFFLFFI